MIALVAAALLASACARAAQGPDAGEDGQASPVVSSPEPRSEVRTAQAAGDACPGTGAATAVRVAGGDRTATAVALAHHGWGASGAPTVVLASARAFPDALAATPWAVAHDAPVLLTEPTQLPEVVASALRDLGTEHVVVVGGTSAVSKAVTDDLEGRGLTVQRLAGSDRFETAAVIAGDLHDQADEAVVVSGQTYADAVAAGPLVSAAPHAPILLSLPDQLPGATTSTLRELQVQRATVVGGSAVVTDRVLEQLRDAGIEPTRISGPDRYATSAAVVEEAATRHGSRSSVGIVTGADYPDALAASALAARQGATVLLVDHDDLIDHPRTQDSLAAHGPAWRCTTVVGGSGAVARRVAEQVVARTGAPPPDGDPVLLAAGDIASCGLRSDEATGALLDTLEGTVLTLGDNVYNDGTAQQYEDCYQPAWGRHLVRTRASLGNHDIRTADGGPTYHFFEVRAGTAGRGWYAFDLGPDWRVLVLNSNCPGTVRCDRDSEQFTWFGEQLDGAGDRHVIVATHHPRWSSGVYAPGETRVAELWQLAAERGADLWLTAHEHGYERFSPKDGSGAHDPAGVHQITAGTGGASLRPFGDPQPGSQVRLVAHGVLELMLGADGYTWRFVDVSGAVRDEGTRDLP